MRATGGVGSRLHFRIGEELDLKAPGSLGAALRAARLVDVVGPAHRPACLVHLATPYATPRLESSRSIALMAGKGTRSPPNPYKSKFLRKTLSAPVATYLTPRRASGIKAMITSALKMTADRIALLGDARPMTFSWPSAG